MQTRSCCLVVASLFLAAALSPDLPAQPPSAEDAAAISARLAELRKSLAVLRDAGAEPAQLVDVEIYGKAAEWILRHEEFYRPNYAADTLTALETGLRRARQLSGGKPAWAAAPGKTVLAYRSAVDGSVQPYALTLPASFDAASPDRRPLHVVLHGRGDSLNEVSFIRQHDGKPAPAEADWIQLDVFGRGNNAYRWAGETDVFEALADVLRRYRIDERRITLWGFSMGGAGAWHLGLHHPSRWSSVGAGAGFVDFYKYQKVTDPLPDYQDKTLRIYDATGYALNLANVPFITYGGEVDPQLAASLTMQAAANEAGTPLQLLIGQGMGHKFDDDSRAKFMAFHAEQSRSGRPAFPGRRDIRFVTYTPKYNRCEWLTVEELQRMYEPATVESKVDDDGVLRVTTGNVAALTIARGVADRVRIDGAEPVDLNDAADGLLPDVYFVRDTDGGAWDVLDYDDSLQFAENSARHKRRDLQGPIDDAFMQPFVCVRGTGEAWSRPLEAWADWTLSRFVREWDKWMRGQVTVVNDTDITDEMLATKHLVLFGDPGSNSVLARFVGVLPLTWKPDAISIGGRTFDTDSHGVALIYANPLSPRRYVVVNSGMTMHDADFRKSNAWLFSKLGDAAAVSFERTAAGSYNETTVWGALFDTHWRLP
jgi:dienelactone hydrolase